jgi:hypothetical protein
VAGMAPDTAVVGASRVIFIEVMAAPC